MKTIVLIIVVYAKSVYGDSVFGCMSMDSFNENNKDFFSKDIGEVIKKKSLSLMDAVIDKSKPIGSGSFGEVVSIKNQQPPLALKILNPQDTTNINAVKEEIKMLTKVCEEKFDETSTKLISCEGKEIAAFKGCVEYKDPIYNIDLVLIFQREAYGTMKGFAIHWKYRNQPAIKRAVMMMRILEKVASLHKKSIVHSDIKPENIVIVKSDMKEFELIDLGMARQDGSAFVGGTPLFYSPEYWNGKKTLTPELDVYSIAMTLLDLETHFSSFVTRTLKECFKPRLINPNIKLTETCHKTILDAVPDAFNHKKSPTIFIEVFQKALAYKKEDRYSSALEFLVDIVDKLYLVPGYKGYIYDLIKRYKEKKEKEDKINKKLGKEPSSTLRWEEVATYLGYDAAPPGLVERAKRFFLCGTKNEILKAPAWKKDMPDYLIPILQKRYGKDIVSAKLGIKSEISTSDKIKLETPLVEEDAKKCIPCLTDDDLEVEQEGERQQVKYEFEENQKMHNPFNVLVWADQNPLEIDQQNQQQII